MDFKELKSRKQDPITPTSSSRFTTSGPETTSDDISCCLEAGAHSQGTGSFKGAVLEDLALKLNMFKRWS
jgi:hypothetical protein